jgi:hypothetical protein
MRGVADASVTITRNHLIVARDGTELVGDLYLPTPNDGRRKPVVVYRTPYGKDGIRSDFFSPLDAIAEGLAAYVQDIRGFGRSGAAPNFIRWDDEAADTYDTLEQPSQEPWCSGAAGMAGASFLAIVQIASVGARHPSLRVVAPAMVTAQP